MFILLVLIFKNMKLTKFSLIAIVLIFSFAFSIKVMAEEKISTEKKLEGKTIVLAEINVQDAKIISQTGNTLEISFNINNKQGAQSGVKYGIRVVDKESKVQKTIDEYVFPEVLSVAANSSISKTVKYTAPVNLDGTYNVFISARNYSGLPLGIADLGAVSFTKQMETLEILSETCSTEIERAGSIKLEDERGNIVSKEDKIVLSCYIKNNLNEEVTTNPNFETHYRTIYGEEVSQLGGDVNPILLRPLEEKLVKLTLPKVVVPQSYITKVYFETNGIKSNYILMSYTISGLSATIQNVSLDKNSYNANETAKIAFFWTSSAKNKEELTSISLQADIVNKNKRSCIESPINTQMAGVGFIEIPVTISKSCDDPEVTISLLDATGKILDQKALIFEANENTNLFSGKMGIIAIIILVLLVIAGLFLYFKNLKKKDDHHDDKPKSGHIEGAMLAILFALAISFIPGGVVKAETYYITADRVDTYYDPSSTYGTIVLNTNLDKSDYSYGDDIKLNTSVYYDKVGHCSTIPLYATANQLDTQKLDFSGESIVCGGDELYAENTFLSAATNSSNIVISGHAYMDGLQEIAVNIPLAYNVIIPEIPTSQATVTVTARNENTGEESVDGKITVTKGTPIRIKWTIQNASGKHFECTYPGGTCGSSDGDVYEKWSGDFYYPETTTAYTVLEK